MRYHLTVTLKSANDPNELPDIRNNLGGLGFNSVDIIGSALIIEKRQYENNPPNFKVEIVGIMEKLNSVLNNYEYLITPILENDFLKYRDGYHLTP